MLVSSLAQEKANNRYCFMKLLSSLKFLARQGSSIRGHEKNEGNLEQLLKLASEDDPKVP